MKAWYSLCIFFFLYSINTLIEDSYDVAYRNTTEGNKTEEYEYLVCFDFKKIIYPSINKTKIDLNQLNQDVHNYFAEIKHSMKTRFFQDFNELILVPIRQRECLVFRGMFCFPAENESILKRINSFKLLFRGISILIAYKNDTFDLVKTGLFNKFDQQIVLHKEYPYSNCIENYSRFHCLNLCFKEKNRLSKYLYRMDETDGIIRLDYDNNNTTLKDNENECFKKCKNDGCKFTYFTKNIDPKKNQKIIIFKAHPAMQSIDYWIQLVGLVFFFTGLSSYQILSKFIKIQNSSTFFNQILTQFIKLIRSKIQRDKLKQRLLNLTKAIIVVIMASCLFYSYIHLIVTYKWNLDEPIKKEISLNLLEPEPISIVICVSLHSKIFKESIYLNKSLLELEKDTDFWFKETLNGIYIEFQNEIVEAKWTLKSKILFYYLSRCFLVDVFPLEPKYQSALLISKLVIKFLHKEYDTFLLPYRQNFHSNSYSFAINYDFIKKITKLSKECENYNRLNSRSPCNSQEECIDRCCNQEFIKNYGNISGYSGIVIDKDHFTKEQWEKTFLNDNFDEDMEIRTKCEGQITKKDCLEVKFERNIKITPIGDEKNIKLDLYYDIIKEIEERPPLYKLILDVMNVQSILFGLNAFKFPVMIYRVIKSKFKICLWFITYVACMGGLVYQTYQILNEIINGDLINNFYYTKIDSIEMPEIIFCFNFDKSLIDMNHKLTGNYLDEITKEIRAETVFDTIRYLDNKKNEWITLKSNFASDQFRIEEFFFLNEKCFKIILVMVYHKDQFHFSFNSNVLKIFFYKKFINRIPYFMTKPKDKIQFSKLLKLNFKNRILFNSIFISQELFELKYYDKFNFIKNPISLFYGENEVNDAAHYLSNLLNNFKKSFNHLKTLKIPLKVNHFKFEVDDDLFEQYYLQVQNVTDNYQTTDSNYQRLLATNFYSEENLVIQNPGFIFNLNFYKKKIEISNDDSSTKLVLNLLNILSFWFDLGILDMHIYFSKIRKIFVFIFTLKYQFLLRAKKSIYLKLNPQLIQNRIFVASRNHMGFIKEIDLCKK